MDDVRVVLPFEDDTHVEGVLWTLFCHLVMVLARKLEGTVEAAAAAVADFLESDRDFVLCDQVLDVREVIVPELRFCDVFGHQFREPDRKPRLAFHARTR